MFASAVKEASAAIESSRADGKATDSKFPPSLQTHVDPSTGAASTLLNLRYANGPLFDLATGQRRNAEAKHHDRDFGEISVFARYQSEFRKGDPPEGIMRGSPAIIGAALGKGRVLACSPHPEKSDPVLAPLLAQMVRWCAVRNSSSGSASSYASTSDAKAGERASPRTVGGGATTSNASALAPARL